MEQVRNYAQRHWLSLLFLSAMFIITWAVEVVVNVIL